MNTEPGLDPTHVWIVNLF